MRMMLVVLLLLAAAAAQQSTADSPSKPQQPAGAAAQRRSPLGTLAQEGFSLAVADALMDRLAQGLVRKNPKLFLSAFEPARVADYATFADGVTATLDQSRSFRTRYHILDATGQEGRGTALVEFEVERVRESGGAAPARRRVQLRLECERGAKGWRIVQLAPGDFLSAP